MPITIPGGFYEDAPGSGTYHDANGNPIPPEKAAEILAALAVATGVPAAEPTGENSTPLPEGFPARDILIAHGSFVTLEAVRVASDEDLSAIDGIGPTTLKRIREASALAA
jgi:hypothetical protein